MLSAAACENSTLTTVEPSPAKCNIALTPSSASVDAGGGPVTFSVSGDTGCAWAPTRAPAATWLVDLTPVSGDGPGQVSFRVLASTGPERSATVAIIDKAFLITQASGCAYDISPPSQQVGSAGGAITLTIAADAECTWTATSNAPWMTITRGDTGRGAGTIGFTVQGNDGPQRSATLTIAGRPYTVSQSSGCTYAVTPPSRTFGALGDSDAFTVQTGASCPWNAEVAIDARPWLQILSNSAGVGPGTVQYRVAPLFFGVRTGTITVENAVHTVTQGS